MDIREYDILTMKKAHPCGGMRWQVLRTGADFRLRCLGCGRIVEGPRRNFEKNIRKIDREPEEQPEDKPEGQPEDKPEEQPEDKPEEQPEDKPEE